MIATPLRTRVEKTYSAPFAAYLYAKETVELPDGGQAREFPRLKFGGAHLQDPEAQLIGDVIWRAALGGGLGLLLWCFIIDFVKRVAGAPQRPNVPVRVYGHLARHDRRSLECRYASRLH